MELKELLIDIQAKTKGILSYHEHPPEPRTPHVKLANACENILACVTQALAALDRLEEKTRNLSGRNIQLELENEALQAGIDRLKELQ